MTNTLIPNGQLVVFNYPAGAGGKMLQNCVGLSQHCVLNKTEYISWQLEYKGIHGSNYYNQKLEWVLATVPDPFRVKDWLAFEIDKDDPVGFNFMGYREGRPITNLDYYNLANRGLWCTTTVHNYDSAEYLLNYWPTIKHVSLVNSEKFARHALAMKNVNLSYDDDWCQLGSTPPDCCFNFDIDSTIYDHDRFLTQVEDLYQYLGFDDFQSTLISEYYKKYIAIHQ